MSDKNTIKTELIVTGFDDTHTVYMARAALARLQNELGVTVDDLAIVQRDADGNIAVQQSLHRDTVSNESSTFWESLADLLFAPESSAGATTEVAWEKCAAVGIEPTFASRVVNQLRCCRSALLVRVDGLAHREKVAGVLQGFVRKAGTGGSSDRLWKTEIHLNTEISI